MQRIVIYQVLLVFSRQEKLRDNIMFKKVAMAMRILLSSEAGHKNTCILNGMNIKMRFRSVIDISGLIMVQVLRMHDVRDLSPCIEY